MEHKAGIIEGRMKKALQRRVEIICGIASMKLGEDVYRDIEISFKRNIPEDINSTINIVNALKGTVSDASLSFKFLYEKAQFMKLDALEGSQEWVVSLPDGETCSFSGSCSIKLDSVGVNAVLTYTLAVKPDSAMVWA